MPSIEVNGVGISFLHRDAALVSDNELADIEEIVEAELDAIRVREDDEVLRHIEFISDYVNPRQARYNTVSDVTGTPE
ncbi:hypothetical protein KHO57_gp139 [Mycobacterium phage Phabba]|uniref:Uncharacterized protein n=1 Tax=Mycobacterium phage Phabba TaxID=2027899 RepID=A0A249XSP3_9CAUD|nr:hypothetical protein KHO57_gp139 [Mycobacterium phage Phabba]ASZ74765.1 hypothetical protein SEA_PHABBA_228 [Mycobacterium phage Phabba]